MEFKLAYFQAAVHYTKGTPFDFKNNMIIS